MDPLNIIAHNHDLALWGRVADYRPADLCALMYEMREFYDLLERVAPPDVQHVASVPEAERYFSRKAFAFRGWCTVRGWVSWLDFFRWRFRMRWHVSGGSTGPMDGLLMAYIG